MPQSAEEFLGITPLVKPGAGTRYDPRPQPNYIDDLLAPIMGGVKEVPLRTDRPEYIAGFEQPPGMLAPGTVDVNARPRPLDEDYFAKEEADGTYLRSPGSDGHFGKFQNAKSAEDYAETLKRWNKVGQEKGLIQRISPDDSGIVEQVGLLEPPNLNLDAQDFSKPPLEITKDRKTYLIPSVVDGKELSRIAAERHFEKTGQHLGVFNSNIAAREFMERQGMTVPIQYANPKDSFPLGIAPQSPSKAQPTPVTYYSYGRSVGGPDEIEDDWTNRGYSAGGRKNLSEGVVAVNPRKYPLGTVFRDTDSGKILIASDTHGGDPEVVDVFAEPKNYRREKTTRNFQVVDQIPESEIPHTKEGVEKLLAEYNRGTNTREPIVPGQPDKPLAITNGIDPRAPYMKRPRPVEAVNRIIVHGDINESAEQLVEYGRKVDKARGFDPGYHFYVARDGKVIQGAPIDRITNHTKGENQNSIGINIAGADEGKMPTPAQETAAKKLIAELGSKYGIDHRNVVGHGELQPNRRHGLEGGHVARDIRERGYDGAQSNKMRDWGIVRPGNIDLSNRPVVQNPDGTVSTLDSISFQDEDGRETLIPRVINGQRVPTEDAIAHYRSTGQHLGKFKSLEQANAYAERLHSEEATRTDLEARKERMRTALERTTGALRKKFQEEGVLNVPRAELAREERAKPLVSAEEFLGLTIPEATTELADTLGYRQWIDAYTKKEVRRASKYQKAEEFLEGVTAIPAAQSWWKNALNSLGRGATSEGGLMAAEGAYAMAEHLTKGTWAEKLFSPSAQQKEAAGKMRDTVRDYLHVDKGFADSLTGMILEGFGQLAMIPLYAFPPAGATAGVTQLFQEARDDYKATMEAQGKPVSEEEANKAGMAYLKVAAPAEILMDVLIVGRFLKGLKKAGKKITVGKLAKMFGVMATAGGATEGTQQWWMNKVAKEALKYDPNRNLDEGVWESIIVGAVVEGVAGTAAEPVGRGVQKLEERAAGKKAPPATGPTSARARTEAMPRRPSPKEFTEFVKKAYGEGEEEPGGTAPAPPPIPKMGGPAPGPLKPAHGAWAGIEARFNKLSKEDQERIGKLPLDKWEAAIAEVEAAGTAAPVPKPPKPPKPAPVSKLPKEVAGKTIYRGYGREKKGDAYNEMTGEAIAGPGNYYSLKEKYAKDFGPNVESVKADDVVTNPLVIRSGQDWRALTDKAGWRFPNPFGADPKLLPAMTAKLKQTVQDMGHDGIVVVWDDEAGTDIGPKGENYKLLNTVFGRSQVISYKAAPSAQPAPAGKKLSPEDEKKAREIREALARFYTIENPTDYQKARIKQLQQEHKALTGDFGPDPGELKPPAPAATGRPAPRSYDELFNLFAARLTIPDGTLYEVADYLKKELGKTYSGKHWAEAIGGPTHGWDASPKGLELLLAGEKKALTWLQVAKKLQATPPAPPPSPTAEEPPAPAEPETPAVSPLQQAAIDAKAKLEALGPEPPQPSPERRFFGAEGREGLRRSRPNEAERIIADYDERAKKYKSWRRKYLILKKAEVEASNAAFREREQQLEAEEAADIARGEIKVFLKSKWDSFDTYAEATATRGKLKVDDDGNIWEWKEGGKRVKAQRVKGAESEGAAADVLGPTAVRTKQDVWADLAEAERSGDKARTLQLAVELENVPLAEEAKPSEPFLEQEQVESDQSPGVVQVETRERSQYEPGSRESFEYAARQVNRKLPGLPTIEVVDTWDQVSSRFPDADPAFANAEAVYDRDLVRIIMIRDNMQDAPPEALQEYIARLAMRQAAPVGGLSRMLEGTPLAAAYQQALLRAFPEVSVIDFGTAFGDQFGYQNLVELAKLREADIQDPKAAAKLIEEHASNVAGQPTHPRWFEQLGSDIQAILGQLGVNLNPLEASALLGHSSPATDAFRAEQEAREDAVRAAEQNPYVLEDISLGQLREQYPEVRLAHLKEIRITEMPELIKLARYFVGNLPILKKLRKALGAAKGDKKTGEKWLYLHPDIFKDYVVAGKVIAHELGHHLDLFAHGKFAGLKGLANKLAKDRKVVKDELVALTHWWKPWDEATAPESYTNYRKSGKELLADALSVFFNSPGELKARAPKFFDTWMDFLDGHTAIKDEIFALQALLHQPHMELLSLRSKELREGFTDAGELWMAAKNKQKTWQETARGWIQDLKDQFYFQYNPAVSRQRGLEKRGVQVDRELDLRRLFDEHPLADNLIYTWLDRMKTEVIDKLHDFGLTQEDLGEYLLLNRVMQGAYSGKPVARGHNPWTARQGLYRLRSQIGLDRWQVLERYADRFHDYVFEIMKEAYVSGMISKDMFLNVIVPNRDTYATFRPIDHVEDHVGAGLYSITGFLDDAENPFFSTMLKMIAFRRGIQWHRAKKASIDFLRKYYPDQIYRRLPLNKHSPEMRIEDPKETGIIKVKEDGSWFQYEVPADYARMFDRPKTPAEVNAFFRALHWTFRKGFYQTFIKFNPAFQLVRSPMRDFQRLYTNMPAGVTLRKIATGYLQSIPAAARRLKGEIDPIVMEMYENMAMATPHDTFARNIERGDPLELIMQQYHLLPETKKAAWRRNKIIEVLEKLGGWVVFNGQVLEAAPKIAAYKILTKDLGWHPQKAAAYVRNYVGVPNYLKKGRKAFAAGTMMPFWNVAIQGLTADTKLFLGHEETVSVPKMTAKKIAARSLSWWLKFTAATGIYAVMQALARHGFLGDDLEELMAGISEYTHTNYMVIPLGKMEGGDFGYKTMFLQIPQDELSRMIGGLLKKTIDMAATRVNDTPHDPFLNEVAQLFGFAGGQLPGAHPLIAIGGRWLDYSMGHNPYDMFRGQHILTNDEHLAGGWASLKPMFAMTADMSGITNFFKFNSDADTTTEAVIENVPILGAVLKVSDYGLLQKQQQDVSEERVASARLRVNLPDNVAKLLREYNSNRRLGKNRTQHQNDRYNQLKIWHKNIYEPTFESAARVRDMGGDPSDTLKRLGESSEGWE